MFWFFSAAHQKASKNTTYVVNYFAFIWQKKVKYLELLLFVERSCPTFGGITLDSVELQKWSCTLEKPQTISKRLIIHVNGARMAQFGLQGNFHKSSQANFCQIRYSSCVILNVICIVNPQNGSWVLFTISQNSLFRGSLYQGLSVWASYLHSTGYYHFKAQHLHLKNFLY